MPPKPKFSREDIINAAFDIVQKNGTDAMTAREVGKYLGTSSTPIFTAFNDMSELRAAVCDKAKRCSTNTWLWRRTSRPHIKSAECSG